MNLFLLYQQIAETIRGSKRAPSDVSSEAFGKGGELGLCIDEWRNRVRQAWLLGLIKREMTLGKGHNLLGEMVFNSFTITPAGEAFLTNPTAVQLPSIRPTSNRLTSSQLKEGEEKRKRQGRGSHALPVIRSLMASSDQWFSIASENDYHYPGVFTVPYPQRMAYCSDISTLAHYDPSNKHFLFTDIQFGKGKARAAQKVKMSVDGKDEDVWYRIVPCGGVKYCGKHEEGCTYITSTRENRHCPQHPDVKLIRSNECTVEFAYLWPVEENDTRRWITGFRRSGTNEESNLHNHPTHAAMKIPSKVENDIRQAVITNPHLKTKDIMTGQ